MPTHVFAAQTYTAGDLIKSPTEPTVYFVASDHKRYAFADSGTYHSWYKDFSKVNVLGPYDIYSYPLGNAKITARPGFTLVKFEGSTKVYAVENGAVLRWIRSESVAQKFYGLNWQARIVTLPANVQTSYVIGQDVDKDPVFSRHDVMARADNLDTELRARGTVVVATNYTVAQTHSDKATLKFLYENLQYNMTPGFDPNVKSYTLAATEQEDKVRFWMSPESTDAKISVNDIVISPATDAVVKLNTGKNEVKITVMIPSGDSTTYTITVNKKPMSGNAYLLTLNKNLKGTLSPEFNSDEFTYDLSADYLETSLRLTAQAEDSRSTITINGEKTSSWYTKAIPLDVGDTTITIMVTAQNGATRTYTLTVHRRQFLQGEDLNLVSLQENLKADLSPKFDPNFTIYHLRAEKKESRVQITVRPKRSEAHVFINDEETQSKTFHLHSGENEVEIRLEIGEFKNTYKLTIDRDI